MGECDQTSIPVVDIPKVWKEGEDFRRELFDRCDLVPPELNRVGDLESILFDDIELEYGMRQSQSLHPFFFVCFTSALSRVIPILQTLMLAYRRHANPIRTHFVPRITLCRIFLVAHKC